MRKKSAPVIRRWATKYFAARAPRILRRRVLLMGCANGRTSQRLIAEKGYRIMLGRGDDMMLLSTDVSVSYIYKSSAKNSYRHYYE